jgi:nitrogen fixation protein NifU and related proteins
MQDLADLYQAVILDHNRRPRNFVAMESPDRVAVGDNPVCGDHYTVFLRLEGDRISEVSFQGAGCAISKASASVMTSLLKGKTAEEARKIYEKFHQMVTTGEVDPENLSDLSAFAGVYQFPARIKCATLSWHAALNAVADPEAGKVSTEE